MTRRRAAILSALLATALGFASPAAAFASTPIVPLTAAGGARPAALTAADPTPAADGTVSITLSPSNGGFVDPAVPTAIDLTIVNGTDDDVAGGVVTLAVSGGVLPSAKALTDWLHPDAASLAQIPVGAAAVRNVDIPPLVAGQRYIASGIDLSTVDLGLDAADPAGAYGLAATFIAAGVTSGGRSAVTWGTQGQPATTNLAVVAPLTVPLSYGGLLDEKELTDLTAENGALTTQLNALVGEPIAIGVDPRIIASIKALGTRAPESAVTWLQRLSTVSNETFALQYGDAQPSVQSQAGLATLLKPTSFAFALNPADFPEKPTTPTETPTPSESPTTPPGEPSSQSLPSTSAAQNTLPTSTAPATGTASEDEAASTTEPTPTPTPTPTGPPGPAVPTLDELLSWAYTIPGIVWSGGVTTQSDLAVYAASGGSETIIDSSNVQDTGSTPSASATVGSSKVLLADSGLAGDLAAAAGAATTADLNGALAELNARVASIGTEGITGRTVLAVLPRGVDGPLPHLADTVNALRTLPAVIPERLSSVIAEPAAAVALTGQTGSADRARDTENLLDDEARIGTFSTVLEQPELLTGEERTTLLSTLAAGWLTDEAGWSQAVFDQRKRTVATLNAVHVADSSRINMVGGEVSLPFAVKNDLAYPVTVVMEASPSNGRLSVAGSVKQNIAANSRATVLLPVQAQIGNGDVTLRLQLFSPTGQSIGAQAFVGVNVRADWEGIGAVVLASFVGLLFIGGIVRMVLTRRARARQPAPAPVPEPVEGPAAPEPTPAVPEPVEGPAAPTESSQVESSTEPKETDG
ncbi:DUF6049 family protein [Plantibacter sp. Mn2098]|uniref:DUF6049 family protein n=1 Tax=Plantibacter sp. Mn2098 TaxID=3395266 RepID=UPI003BCB86B2